MARNGTRFPAGAFTLVESILVVLIVALLIALLIPSLGHVRQIAFKTASAANIRSHAAVMATYTNDFSEANPYLTDPHAQYTVFRGGGINLTVGYFEVHAFWNIALADSYYNGSVSNRSFGTPGHSATSSEIGYYYSCSFIARPEYWDPSTRSGVGQWEVTRVHDVVFPGQKALLLDTYRWDSKRAVTDGVWQLGMFDGSVRDGAGDRPGYAKGDGPGSSGFYHNSDWPPTMHTLNGVRGRDID